MGNGCSSEGGEITLGPWGCRSTAGTGTGTCKEWSFRPKSKQPGNITQIIIKCNQCIIYSIMFRGENDGDFSTKFGGHGGDTTFKIDINFPAEYLTGVSGTYEPCSNNVPGCTSLSFQTNKKQYGPFGSGRGGKAFSVNADGGAITGFHGRHGIYVEAIGIYIMPDCIFKALFVGTKQPSEINDSSSLPCFLSPPRGAGPRGGDGGREWDDGVFSAVIKVEMLVGTKTSGVLTAVRFCYLKSDGSEFLSPFHGGDSGGETDMKTICFDKDEKLIGVEGFVGAVKGVNVVTSLSFITDKAKYGPVGDEIGTFFTFINYAVAGDLMNRKVVGFHGRSGAYLDAIGLHTLYS